MKRYGNDALWRPWKTLGSQTGNKARHVFSTAAHSAWKSPTARFPHSHSAGGSPFLLLILPARTRYNWTRPAVFYWPVLKCPPRRNPENPRMRSIFRRGPICMVNHENVQRYFSPFQ
jgi:hypothetical protein